MLTVPFGSYGLGVSVLLVSIMLAVGGLLFGIGYAVNDRRFKEIGRAEIMQSLINGALVGGFLLFFVKGGIVDSLLSSLVLANGTSASCSSFLQENPAICFAYNYLIGTSQYYYMGSYHLSILAIVTPIIVGLISLYAVLGLYKLFLSPVLAQIQSAVQVLGAVAVGATVQASVLMFIAASALTLILPLGLVLRTFFPTRKLGSFMIALTLGLYLILPLTYLMNAMIAATYSTASMNSNVTTLGFQGMKSDILAYVAHGTNDTSIVQSLTNLEGSVMTKISELINSLFSMIAYFIVYVFVLPALSLMLTAISIKELAVMLGSDNFFGKFNLL